VVNERTKRILEYDKIIHELASLAATEPGRELCLALEPSNDFQEVSHRQKMTDDAVRIILEKSVPPLSGLIEIRPVLARVQTQASLSCKELMGIGQFLRAVSRLHGFLPLSSNQLAENLVYQTIQRIVPVPSLENSISYAIAGEEELYDHASQALMNIRRRIRDTQAEVKSHLERIVRNNPKSLQEQLITLRGNRYVVPVRSDHRADIPGIIHDTSSSGATLFIEPYPVIEANNRIREYLSEERDEIDRILMELSAEVYDKSDILRQNSEVAATVDFLFAKARHAVQINAMPPVINMEGKIRLLAARHPLIGKDRVVPITIELGYDFDTLVITGPNTGGKTVSLKTCGLFCLMAMAGLQIPAKEHSTVSIFDTIVADIGDEQSIEQNLSTFSSHMSNLVRIVSEAGPSTLVLLDELGAGTDPSEGAALAISILEFLQSHHCRTIATTHYKELKIFAIHTVRVENACCEFDVETLRPTFKLLIGIPGVSNAFSISSRLGLRNDIIDRARELLTQEEVEFEKVIADTELARKSAIQMEEKAKTLLDEARNQADAAKNILKELESKKKDILLKAREEAKEYIEEAYVESQSMIDDMKKAVKERDAAETRKRLDDTRNMLKMRKTQLENEIGKSTLNSYKTNGENMPIILGETYFTSALGISGMLVEFTDSKGNCILLHGNKRVTVPVTSLRPVENGDDTGKKGKDSRRKAMSGMTMSKKMTMGTEIKLIGMTVEEASEQLDKFVDDAILTGIKTIRIVHGKGTGALRSAISQQLKRDKRIVSYRLGEYGEGDSGVTIAQL
jgi:DNA mismatch repair protein MutS2